jgi:hypothetical protein
LISSNIKIDEKTGDHMKLHLIFPVILFSLCATPFALDQITTDASGVGKTKEEALLNAKKKRHQRCHQIITQLSDRN